MSIQRVPSVPFAQIANEALRDKRLSFKARGVLAMVLSHSGEWNATARWLEEQSDKDGRESIQNALNELNKLGYREVFKERDEKGDIRTVVVWRQVPEMLVSRPTGDPTVGKPDRRKTRGSSEHNSSEHNSSEHNKEKEHQEESPQEPKKKTAAKKDPEGFAEFYAVYPRRVQRAYAVKAWVKAVLKESPQTIIDAARVYALSVVDSDPQFIPHPATWLNGEQWADEVMVRKPKRADTPGNRRMDYYEELLQDIRTRSQGAIDE